MTRRALVEIFVVATVLTFHHPLSAQPATTDTSRGFSIRYADGRTTTRPIRPKGGMMTAIFPRLDGAETAHEGMLLNGLDVTHVVEGQDLVVTVSLMYRNGAHRATVNVATVRVPPGTTVAVNELRSYGVEPIALSIVSIPAAYAFPPRGVSVSPHVDVRATPIGPNPSAYRVTITNRAAFPLLWVRFEAHRNSGSPISAMPSGKRNYPLIMPGGEHTFELPTGSLSSAPEHDAVAWEPLDRIELTSLMWQDGVVEGNLETARLHDTFARQKAQHLRVLISILRTARSAAALRDDLLQMQVPQDVELSQERKTLLERLDRFVQGQSSADGLAYQSWRRRAMADQEQWLARIVFSK